VDEAYFFPFQVNDIVILPNNQLAGRNSALSSWSGLIKKLLNLASSFVIIFTKAFLSFLEKGPNMFYIIVTAWILFCFARWMLDPRKRLKLIGAFKDAKTS